MHFYIYFVHYATLCNKCSRALSLSSSLSLLSVQNPSHTFVCPHTFSLLSFSMSLLTHSPSILISPAFISTVLHLFEILLILESSLCIMSLWKARRPRSFTSKEHTHKTSQASHPSSRSRHSWCFTFRAIFWIRRYSCFGNIHSDHIHRM